MPRTLRPVFVVAFFAASVLLLTGCLEVFDQQRVDPIAEDIRALNEEVRGFSETLKNSNSPEIRDATAALTSAADRLTAAVDTGLDNLDQAFNEDGTLNPQGASAAAATTAGAINPALAAPIGGVAFLISTVIAELQRRKKNDALTDLENQRRKLIEVRDAFEETVAGVSNLMQKKLPQVTAAQAGAVSPAAVEALVKSALAEAQSPKTKALVDSVITKQKGLTPAEAL